MHDALSALAATTGKVVSCSPISPLTSVRWSRGAVRFAFADGTVAKGRHFESEAAAARFVTLSRMARPGLLPRIIAHDGQNVLVEWIEGDTVHADRVAPSILMKAGALLRQVHQTPMDSLAPSDTRRLYPGPSWEGRLSEKLDRLLEAALISSGESARLLAIARSNAPPDAPLRLILGDLAPENVVSAPSGAVRIIDSDGLDLHVPAFDLARAWYRWPMTPAQLDAFEIGYGDPPAFAAFRRAHAHWAIVVLAGAAHFRLTYSLKDAGQPIDRLRRLLE